MKKPVFAPLILAFLVLVILVLIPNKWIAGLIPKSRINEAATELNPFMFQGKYIQDRMLDNQKFMPIYGSSELARLDQFHPANYFHVTGETFTPFLVGRGGTESLIHLLNFSEHMEQLRARKLVFVLSPQWFQPNGTDESHFVPNYSALQGYDFAFNKEINSTVKKQAIKRLLTFSSVKDDPILSTLYRAEITNTPSDKRKAAFVKPVAYAYRHLLEKKDLYYSLFGGISRHRDIKYDLKNKSWIQLEEDAARIGAKDSRNNEFGVINSQYNKIKDMLPSLKGKKVKGSYGDSPEYDDFQLVLDVLKQSGAHALFISVPVNGKWYDYTGFPKEGRIAYYERIKKQIEADSFEVADFSDHEYDPFFMKDTIHIGWKGWVYTDKAIKDFYEGFKVHDQVVVAR